MFIISGDGIITELCNQLVLGDFMLKLRCGVFLIASHVFGRLAKITHLYFDDELKKLTVVFRGYAMRDFPI